PFRVLTAHEPWGGRADGVPRRAALSGFGFGGVNAHVLVGEWGEGGASFGAALSPFPGGAAPSSPPPLPLAGGGGGKPGGPPAAPGPAAPAARGEPPAAAGARLFGQDARPPAPARRRWGSAEAGFFVDDVRVEAGRFRIPPRDLPDLLPQQSLMLNV